MQRTGMTLEDVVEVYSGFEGRLWELIMGEQIHIGGYASSKVLGDLAGWRPGQEVVDLCSALGAGMHFLVRTYGVKAYGVDATPLMVEESLRRLTESGLGDSTEVKLGDALDIPYPDGRFDGVWGEDAWCYVEDKERLISEAARVLRPGGTIAFTDWLTGPSGIDEESADRICRMMKFPYMLSLEEYSNLLERNGFRLTEVSDLTTDFADHLENYIGQLTGQRHFDAMQIIGWNREIFEYMGGEFAFMLKKARDGGFGRGRFVGVLEEQ